MKPRVTIGNPKMTDKQAILLGRTARRFGAELIEREPKALVFEFKNFKVSEEFIKKISDPAYQRKFRN